MNIKDMQQRSEASLVEIEHVAPVPTGHNANVSYDEARQCPGSSEVRRKRPIMWIANLSLWQKGLILVSVPLVFELMFMAILTVLLMHTEDIARREAHSRAVATAAKDLSQHCIDAGASIVAFKLTKSARFIERYERSVGQIPSDLDLLVHLAQGDRRREKVVHNLDAIGRRVLRLMRLYSSAVQSGDYSSFLNLRNLERETEAVSNQFWRELEAFISIEKEIQHHTPDMEEQSRRLWKMAIGIGILLNIAIAIGLAFLFSKTTASRLNDLVENTDLLALGRPIGPLLPGQDEIAHLDKVFHKMAQALSEAAQKRRELVSMIGHDLRTPLASLRVVLSTLTQGVYGNLTDKGQTRVLNAEKSVLRLIQLINDLIAVEQMGSETFAMNFTTVSLQSIIEQSVESIHDLAEKHRVIVTNAATNRDIYADGGRLAQVMINLLGNAIKYSPEGETVSISIKEEGPWITVMVSDRGRGIPLDHKEKIFERFQRLNNNDAIENGGFGLGLAICRTIIEQHGGEVGVNSEPGQGSTFWFRIPVIACSSF